MMSSFSMADLALGIDASVEHLDAQTQALMSHVINTDTRAIKAGDVFLALRGEHFDGHKYIEQAKSRGAIAAIVDEQYFNDQVEISDNALPMLVVVDTLLALGKAGLWNREKFSGPVIAITGSAGKTSVKSMAAHMMTLVGETWSTPGNFNNHVGVPLTLLGLSPEHKAAVIELGASGAGEIAYTAQFTQPDVAIITNVSGAHLEGFGSIDVIMRTKGEIIDSLSSKGCAILNADDVFYADWLLRAGSKKTISFGIQNYADVMAKNIRCTEKGCYFDVDFQQQLTPCSIPLLGLHNVSNALSVVAAGLALGMNIESIVTQLKTMPVVDGRLQWVDGEGGIRILNDSYNASPASVKAAIDVLALWKEDAWLVLGDMAELGESSAQIHADMGEYAKQVGIARLVATGKSCRFAVDAFKENAHWFEQQSELLDYINKNKQPGQVFLVKGSRSAGMDNIVTALALKSVTSSLNSIGEV